MCGARLTAILAPVYRPGNPGANVEDAVHPTVPVMSDPPAVRPDSPPNVASVWTATRRLFRPRSLSRVQALVGTLAGIISIGGAAFSVVHAGRAANTGDLVAIVKAAGGRVTVPDATVEVLTTRNAVVATLTPDATGRVTRELPEGLYVVRISHPRYAADVRRVQVLPRQTVEIRASLRAGSSSPSDHAVNNTFNAIRRAFHF